MVPNALQRRALLAALPMLGLAMGRPASAQPGGVELSVTQWGSSLYGLPFAVAMEKGLFRQAGIDVTGIIGSGGGGTTVRNTLAGAFPYGEVATAAALAAHRSGLDVILVNLGTDSVAEASLVVPIDSPLHSADELVGKKVAVTTPKSVSEMLLMLALRARGVDPAQVVRVVSGGYGQGLTMLDHGVVAAAALIEPLSISRRDRYRPLLAMKDILPPMATSFGLVERGFAAANAGRVRAVIAGRRAGVQDIYANPRDAGAILAKSFNIDPDLAQQACANMVASRMWSEGAFEQVELDRIADGLRLVGELDGAVDWGGIVDKSYLPADLRGAT